MIEQLAQPDSLHTMHSSNSDLLEEIDAHVKLCPQEYLKLRTAAVNAMKENGQNPYPHKFHVSMSLTDFVEKYNDIEDGTIMDEVVSVAGRR